MDPGTYCPKALIHHIFLQVSRQEVTGNLEELAYRHAYNWIEKLVRRNTSGREVRTR
jgi:hypothetical protein